MAYPQVQRLPEAVSGDLDSLDQYKQVLDSVSYLYYLDYTYNRIVSLIGEVQEDFWPGPWKSGKQPFYSDEGLGLEFAYRHFLVYSQAVWERLSSTLLVQEIFGQDFGERMYKTVNSINTHTRDRLLTHFGVLEQPKGDVRGERNKVAHEPFIMNYSIEEMLTRVESEMGFIYRMVHRAYNVLYERLVEVLKGYYRGGDDRIDRKDTVALVTELLRDYHYYSTVQPDAYDERVHQRQIGKVLELKRRGYQNPFSLDGFEWAPGLPG